jgi:hypothetical protein
MSSVVGFIGFPLQAVRSARPLRLTFPNENIDLAKHFVAYLLKTSFEIQNIPLFLWAHH